MEKTEHGVEFSWWKIEHDDGIIVLEKTEHDAGITVMEKTEHGRR